MSDDGPAKVLLTAMVCLDDTGGSIESMADEWGQLVPPDAGLDHLEILMSMLSMGFHEFKKRRTQDEEERARLAHFELCEQEERDLIDE